MASLCKDKNGNKRIIFVDTDGRRKPIRLGKMPMEAARQIKTKVEHLIGAKTSRCAWNAETALWVSELDTVLADKLAAVGLVPKRTATKHGRAGLYLGDFLKDYIKGREADAKPNTLANMRQAERYLVECFGANKLLREISAGDGDDYGRRAIGPTTPWPCETILSRRAPKTVYFREPAGRHAGPRRSGE